MSDHRLLCTNCNTEVVATLSYDGYGARCECTSHTLKVGGDDLPPQWEQVGDVSNPTNFTVWKEGHIRVGEIVDSPFVECIEHTCDGGEVEVMLEQVDVYGYDAKATFVCHGEHGLSDRPNESVAYYYGEPPSAIQKIAEMGETDAA